MATKLHRNKGEQFFDSTGSPLAGGKLRYERAATSTLLPTYSDQAGSTPNTQTDNRIILNSAGRLTEPVYIDDSFDAKETLFTSADVIVDPWPFDNIPKAVDPTAGLSDFAKPLNEWSTDTASSVNVSTSNFGTGRLADTSSNSITYSLPSASSAGNGKSIVVKKTSGSNAVIMDPDGSETIDGSATFSWTENKRAFKFTSDGANWRVETDASDVALPQGYLTLVSGTPVITSDQISATTVYYTLDRGNLAPIYDGSRFRNFAFPELSLSLVSEHAADTIYDVFVWIDSGTVRIGTGPAWSDSSAGSGDRGTGSETTELERIDGLYTNKVEITARNGSTTYTVSSNRGTYVGSIYIDGTAGQVTCHRSYGQSRKWGLWNAYNRRTVILKGGDSTASWSYSSGTLRASNNDSSNSLTVFQGLPEEFYQIKFAQRVVAEDNVGAETAIGFNSTSTASGRKGAAGHNSSTDSNRTDDANAIAEFFQVPSLGINTVNALEGGNGDSCTFYGGEDNMVLSAIWQG